MDVWFDSGVVHHCVPQMRTDVTAPSDLYLEGSIKPGLVHSRSSPRWPCTAAPLSSRVDPGSRDEKGRKMSKSVGNTLVPPS